MSQRPGQTELKITVAKLVELAYHQNKGITTRFLKDAGTFRITIDSEGRASISGSAGSFTYTATEALQSVGVRVKAVRIEFSTDGEERLDYSGTIQTAIFAIAIHGSFDPTRLILACSGLLCNAARALKSGTTGLHERRLLEAAN